MSTLKPLPSQRKVNGWVWLVVTLLVIGAFVAGLVIGVVFYHYGPAKMSAEEAYYRGAFAGCYFELVGVEKLNTYLPETTHEEKVGACNTVQKALKDDDNFKSDLQGREDLFD